MFIHLLFYCGGSRRGAMRSDAFPFLTVNIIPKAGHSVLLREDLPNRRVPASRDLRLRNTTLIEKLLACQSRPNMCRVFLAIAECAAARTPPATVCAAHCVQVIPVIAPYRRLGLSCCVAERRNPLLPTRRPALLYSKTPKLPAAKATKCRGLDARSNSRSGSGGRFLNRRS